MSLRPGGSGGRLYEYVLEKPLDRLEGVVRARRPKRLPVVPTVDEVSRVLMHLGGDKWLVAMLLYYGGLRLLEALRLQTQRTREEATRNLESTTRSPS